jgi:uncharacterized transporter YbjL
MATPAHACARILSALEELVMQEAVVLTAGDLAAVGEIQSRIEPLVAFLATQDEDVMDADFKARVAALYAARADSAASLKAQMARNRAEVLAISGRQRVIAQVAPAYGAAAAPATLSLVG